jgi:hypothetical protein
MAVRRVTVHIRRLSTLAWVLGLAACREPWARP